MINDGTLITANNWPSAWKPRGKKEAPRCTLRQCTLNVTQGYEMSVLIKKSH